jgi:hypothetical protein
VFILLSHDRRRIVHANVTRCDRRLKSAVVAAREVRHPGRGCIGLGLDGRWS